MVGRWFVVMALIMSVLAVPGSAQATNHEVELDSSNYSSHRAAGDRVVFRSFRPSGTELVSVRPDGTGEVILSTEPGDVLRYGVTDDGGEVVYVMVDGSTWTMYSKDVAGGAATTIATGATGPFPVRPTYIGRNWIVFEGVELDLWSVPRGGGTPARLTPIPSVGSPQVQFQADWVSPDEDLVYFEFDPDGTGREVYVAAIDGSDTTVFYPGNAWGIVPTPDHVVLVLQDCLSSPCAYPMELYAADGSMRRLGFAADPFPAKYDPITDRLVVNFGPRLVSYELDPTVLFAGQDELASVGVNFEGISNVQLDRGEVFFLGDLRRSGEVELWRIEADGGVVEPVSAPLTRSHDGPSVAYYTISPDGSKVAYVANPRLFSDQDLFVVRRDGSGARQLSNTGTYPSSVVWSADGSHLAYEVSSFGRPVKVVPVSGAHWPTVVTKLDSSDQIASAEIIGDRVVFVHLERGSWSLSTLRSAPFIAYRCMGVPVTHMGTELNDRIIGTNDDDSFMTLDGNDSVKGLDGNDRFCLGRGKDRAWGGDGDDRIAGGPGADRLAGQNGDDTLIPSRGHDFLIGGRGTDVARFADAKAPMSIDLAAGTATGDGTDTLSSIENVEGSRFGDVIRGDNGRNAIHGGDGPDRLIGGDGPDRLFGEDGNDTLIGEAGSDLHDGGPGRDSVSWLGSPGAVSVDLATGVATGWGRDVLSAIEDIVGSNFADLLRGDDGPNLIKGGDGPDTIRGRGGDDVMEGQGGNDNIDGQGGIDIARGGPGADTCVAETVSSC